MCKLNYIAAAIAAQILVILPTQAQSPKFDISAFSVEGNTLLPQDKIQSTLSSFVGTGREMSDVNQAASALRTLYHNAGYAVVQVVAPVQTIASGQVLLKVVEDKVTAIEVKGTSAYDAENIRASLPSLQTGKSLNANQLEAAITLANENSAKQIAINVLPGALPGDISTTINVTEDRVTKLVATYDNTGSAATGFNKIGLAYQNANLFNRDHALTLQYNGTLDFIDKVYSFSLGYHIPFYQSGFSADLMAAYSSSSGQNVNLYFSGKGTVLGARLNYALPNAGDVRHKLIAGIDYKDSESVAGPIGLSVVTPITEIPVSLTYLAQVARPEFQGNGSVTYITNISGGRNGKADDYYNPATNTGARLPALGSTQLPSTRWQAVRLNGSGGFALPQDWQARVGVNTQFSNDLLLPSEQFGAGGASSVRGYPERIISGDQGYTANFELYSPDMNKHLALPESSLRALVFWDVGGTSINDTPLPASINQSNTIAGLGFGLRLTYKKDLSLKFDFGKAQKTVGIAPNIVNQGDTYSSVSLSYVF